jgi:protein-disulfide isomerase
MTVRRVRVAATSTRKVNWFAILVSGFVVVLLVAVAWVVIALNNAATDPGASPTAEGIDTATGAIVVGTGEDRLDTYIDFMCPACNQFEQTYGSEIESMVEDGSLTLGIHPISILDRTSQGSEFSTRSANAAYCVAEADAAAALLFVQAMFAQQPAEGTTGLTNAEILEIASSVGVTGIDTCVNEGTYTGYVQSVTAKTPTQPGAEGIGTPTLAVNGEVIANTTLPDPNQLATLFN